MSASPSPTLSDSNALLGAAIAFSVALHAIVLILHFSPLDPFKVTPRDSALEVIVVNSKSLAKPVKATAIAQADLNGGGEQEQGRATSFLPASAQSQDGDVLQESMAAQARLEAEQQQLLASLKKSSLAAPAPSPSHDAETQDETSESAAAMARSMARMAAEIDKEINDYNSRPRRGYIGPQTRGAVYAQYFTQWRDKVTRVGMANYPPELRNKLYGELTLTVTLNPDGTIYNNEVTVHNSSGSKVIDRAAVRVVRMSAPFAPFPPEMRSAYDVFEVAIKMTFSRGDAFEARIEKK